MSPCYESNAYSNLYGIKNFWINIKKFEFVVICENCGKEHDGSYGSGRFCCKSCSISFGNKNRRKSKETKQKISESVSEYCKTHSKKTLYTYTCEKCGKEFKSTKIRKGRKIHCTDCKRHVVYTKSIESIDSILELSKRTITKILKRANPGCSLCGWNKSTCDIHHIIPKKIGGNNDMSNLIIVCPNCHRIIHSEGIFTYEYLRQHSMEKMFSDWKTYYNREFIDKITGR